MARVTVEKRQFTNEGGNIVPYNVIVIRGSLNGVEQSIEKSVSRTEAMLIGMLLDSDEDLNVRTSHSAGTKIDVKRKGAKAPSDDDGLSFLDE